MPGKCTCLPMAGRLLWAEEGALQGGQRKQPSVEPSGEPTRAGSPDLFLLSPQACELEELLQ